MSRIRRHDTLIRHPATLLAEGVAQPLPVTRRAPRPCRIFVSYAHEEAAKEDKPRAKSTLDEFETCLWGILPQLSEKVGGLTRQDVFIDRDRLGGEYAWDEAIKTGLDTCDLVIFLVSRHSAVPERFCMTHELPRALKRGVHVVTVLVEAVPGWTSRLVPGTQWLLGALHSGGLPKANGNTDVYPINQWKLASDAWAAVGEHLLVDIPRLMSPADSATQPSMPAFSPRTVVNDPPEEKLEPRLLPFLCDHSRHDEQFRDELAAWSQHPRRQALVTVVRGRYADGATDFAQRLIATRLKPRARMHFGLPAPEDLSKCLVWPERRAQGDRFAGYSLLRSMLGKLNAQLEASADTCTDAKELGRLLHRYLSDCQTPQVLTMTVPPRIAEGDFRASLSDLLAGLASAYRDDLALAKLWLFIVDERPNASPKPTGLTVPDSTRLVWLEPMKRVSRNDVEEWHQEHAAQHGADAWLSFKDCVALFHRTASQSPRQRLMALLGLAELSLKDWADAVNAKRMGRRDPAS